MQSACDLVNTPGSYPATGIPWAQYVDDMGLERVINDSGAEIISVI